VLNLIRTLDVLYTGIDYEVLVLKEWSKITTADVAILVNRGGQDHPTMLLVPSRIVGAAAEE